MESSPNTERVIPIETLEREVPSTDCDFKPDDMSEWGADKNTRRASLIVTYEDGSTEENSGLVTNLGLSGEHMEQQKYPGNSVSIEEIGQETLMRKLSKKGILTDKTWGNIEKKVSEPQIFTVKIHMKKTPETKVKHRKLSGNVRECEASRESQTYMPPSFTPWPQVTRSPSPSPRSSVTRKPSPRPSRDSWTPSPTPSNTPHSVERSSSVPSTNITTSPPQPTRESFSISPNTSSSSAAVTRKSSAPPYRRPNTQPPPPPIPPFTAPAQTTIKPVTVSTPPPLVPLVQPTSTLVPSVQPTSAKTTQMSVTCSPSLATTSQSVTGVSQTVSGSSQLMPSWDQCSQIFEARQQNEGKAERKQGIMETFSIGGKQHNVQTYPINEKQHNVKTYPIDEKQHNVKTYPIDEKQSNLQTYPIDKKQHSVQTYPIDEKQHNVKTYPIDEKQHNVKTNPIDEKQHNVKTYPIDENQHNMKTYPIDKKQHTVKTYPIDEKQHIVKTNILGGRQQTVQVEVHSQSSPTKSLSLAMHSQSSPKHMQTSPEHAQSSEPSTKYGQSSPPHLRWPPTHSKSSPTYEQSSNTNVKTSSIQTQSLTNVGQKSPSIDIESSQTNLNPSIENTPIYSKLFQTEVEQSSPPTTKPVTLSHTNEQVSLTHTSPVHPKLHIHTKLSLNNEHSSSQEILLTPKEESLSSPLSQNISSIDKTHQTIESPAYSPEVRSPIMSRTRHQSCSITPVIVTPLFPPSSKASPSTTVNVVPLFTTPSRTSSPSFTPLSSRPGTPLSSRPGSAPSSPKVMRLNSSKSTPSSPPPSDRFTPSSPILTQLSYLDSKSSPPSPAAISAPSSSKVARQSCVEPSPSNPPITEVTTQSSCYPKHDTSPKKSTHFSNSSTVSQSFQNSTLPPQSISNSGIRKENSLNSALNPPQNTEKYSPCSSEFNPRQTKSNSFPQKFNNYISLQADSPKSALASAKSPNSTVSPNSDVIEIPIQRENLILCDTKTASTAPVNGQIKVKPDSDSTPNITKLPATTPTSQYQGDSPPHIAPISSTTAAPNYHRDSTPIFGHIPATTAAFNNYTIPSATRCVGDSILQVAPIPSATIATRYHSDSTPQNSDPMTPFPVTITTSKHLRDGGAHTVTPNVSKHPVNTGHHISGPVAPTTSKPYENVGPRGPANTSVNVSDNMRSNLYENVGPRTLADPSLNFSNNMRVAAASVNFTEKALHADHEAKTYIRSASTPSLARKVSSASTASSVSNTSTTRKMSSSSNGTSEARKMSSDSTTSTARKVSLSSSDTSQARNVSSVSTTSMSSASTTLGMPQQVRVIPISLEDGRVLENSRDERQKVQVEQVQANKIKNQQGKAAGVSFLSDVKPTFISEEVKGDKNEDKVHRVIPIQMDNGETIMPCFTQLQESMPPEWSVFHQTGREKERIVPLHVPDINDQKEKTSCQQNNNLSGAITNKPRNVHIHQTGNNNINESFREKVETIVRPKPTAKTNKNVSIKEIKERDRQRHISNSPGEERRKLARQRLSRDQRTNLDDNKNEQSRSRNSIIGNPPDTEQGPRTLTMRSKSVDADRNSNGSSRGSRTGSSIISRERSLQDIDKDIETIWKELQELDSLPSSRPSSRAEDTFNGKSRECSTTPPPPLSEIPLVKPSWKCSTSPPQYKANAPPTKTTQVTIKDLPNLGQPRTIWDPPYDHSSPVPIKRERTSRESSQSRSWDNKPQYNLTTTPHFSFVPKSTYTRPGAITPTYLTSSPRVTPRSGQPSNGMEEKNQSLNDNSTNLKSCLKTDARNQKPVYGTTMFPRTRSASPAATKPNVNFKQNPTVTLYSTNDSRGNEVQNCAPTHPNIQPSRAPTHPDGDTNRKINPNPTVASVKTNETMSPMSGESGRRRVPIHQEDQNQSRSQQIVPETRPTEEGQGHPIYHTHQQEPDRKNSGVQQGKHCVVKMRERSVSQNPFITSDEEEEQVVNKRYSDPGPKSDPVKDQDVFNACDACTQTEMLRKKDGCELM